MKKQAVKKQVVKKQTKGVSEKDELIFLRKKVKEQHKILTDLANKTRYIFDELTKRLNLIQGELSIIVTTLNPKIKQNK